MESKPTQQIMKRLLVISALLIACAGLCNGQNLAKYQGEVNLGYSIGVGNLGFNKVNLHTVQGVKMGDYVSAGLGFGLDWWRGIYKEYWEEQGKFDLGELTLPIYLNVKGYLPVKEDMAPYISCDIGYAAGLTKGVKNLAGLYFSPSVGLKFKSFKAELGFTLQKVDDEYVEYYYETTAATAFKLSVGYFF
jgi:hypothetical protein